MAMDTLREMQARYPKAKSTLGLSNVSHGLPDRKMINRAFATTAIFCGLYSAICDPLDPGLRKAIVLGNLLAGKDRHCRSYARRVQKGEISS
jgi:5-methyltetrahydrofolate--homocysteine methyltransferase